MEHDVSFVYEGDNVAFDGANERDYILEAMRRDATFYERHVLERIRDRLRARAATGGTIAACIDAGAFIGTHAIYFARYCGLTRVTAFEPNPNVVPVLMANIATNAVTGIVRVENQALGAASGRARQLRAIGPNLGTTSVAYDAAGELTVTRIDDQELSDPVTLIKIDVEGNEMAVLAGARETIQRDKPVLCVEVHGAKNLRLFQRFLNHHGYWIVDCLGASPTYIAEPIEASAVRKFCVNTLWMARTVFGVGRLRGALRHLALHAGAGMWRPPDSAPKVDHNARPL
jgi:FkbM family methyltransferase